MKKIFRVFLGSLFLLTVHFQAVGAENVKIAVVNMKEFQQKSKAFKKIGASLKEKLDTLQKKLDTEKEELLKLEEELKKQSIMLSLDAKEDKQMEVEKKRRYYKYLADEFRFELKAAEEEANKKFTLEVGKIVEEIGKKRGYTMIFQKNSPGLVYINDAIDITDEIIKLYDKKGK